MHFQTYDVGPASLVELVSPASTPPSTASGARVGAQPHVPSGYSQMVAPDNGLEHTSVLPADDDGHIAAVVAQDLIGTCFFHW